LYSWGKDILKDVFSKIDILGQIALSESHIREGRFEEAIALLREMISKNPTLAGAIHNLRYALHEQGTAKIKIHCGHIDCVTISEVDVYPTNAVGAQFVIANYAIKYAELPETVRHIQCPKCNETTMYTFALCPQCLEGYVSLFYVNMGDIKKTGKNTRMEKMWVCQKCQYRPTFAEYKTPDELKMYEELLQFRPEIMSYVEYLEPRHGIYGPPKNTPPRTTLEEEIQKQKEVSSSPNRTPPRFKTLAEVVTCHKCGREYTTKRSICIRCGASLGKKSSFFKISRFRRPKGLQ